MVKGYLTKRGVTFRKTLTDTAVHSAKDLELYPAKRPAIDPAEVREDFVEVPGMHGRLDFSEALTGYPLYGDRNGTFEFWPERDYDGALSRTTEALHGKRMLVIQDEIPDVYLEGRMQVKGKNTGVEAAGIVVSGTFGPWYRYIQDTTEDWLWDPFSFEVGVIREYPQGDDNSSGLVNIAIPASTDTDFTFYSSPYGGCPEFKATGAVTLSYKNPGATQQSQWTLPTSYGTLESMELPTNYSPVKFRFYSTAGGTVSIKYRGGRL